MAKIKFPRIAVVVTILNEESVINLLLAALKRQTITPSEIIFVDGGSTDKTVRILRSEHIKFLIKPGNRSVGRNFAVSHTTSPLIAFTDAGCIPDDDWLEQLAKPFSDSSVQIVSGYYRGLPQNTFQKCLIPYVLVMPDLVHKSEFFPSTRSMALRRSVWDKSGGFDLHLWHNEDYAFAHKLKKLGFNFTFAKPAVVSWLPRKDLRSATWMFMRFAIGDIQAGIIRPGVTRLAIRYLVAIYIFFLGLQTRIFLSFFIILFFCYLLWSIKKNYKYVRDIRAVFWLPVLQLTADFAILFGSLVGLLSRISS